MVTISLLSSPRRRSRDPLLAIVIWRGTVDEDHVELNVVVQMHLPVRVHGPLFDERVQYRLELVDGSANRQIRDLHLSTTVPDGASRGGI